MFPGSENLEIGWLLEPDARGPKPKRRGRDAGSLLRAPRPGRVDDDDDDDDDDDGSDWVPVNAPAPGGRGRAASDIREARGRGGPAARDRKPASGGNEVRESGNQRAQPLSRERPAPPPGRFARSGGADSDRPSTRPDRSGTDRASGRFERPASDRTPGRPERFDADRRPGSDRSSGRPGGAERPGADRPPGRPGAERRPGDGRSSSGPARPPRGGADGDKPKSAPFPRKGKRPPPRPS